MMELNYLRVFYEVAKAGRFTEAAKRLNISQSALSRSVSLLEESEGVLLFERSKNGVSLTPTGAEVFRHCEQLFQTVNRIKEVCSGNLASCEGPIRFGTTDHALNYLLAQPIQNFRREFPRTIPSVFIGSPDEVIDSLINTENEFGLVFAKILTPQIEYEALREEPMALVVQAEVWRENKTAAIASTLNRVLDKVGYISSVGAHTQVRATRVLKELFGKMPPIGFETNGQESQKRICLEGGGVAYLSRFMVEEEIRAGKLHEITLENPHAFKLWLATRKGKAPSLPAKMFLDRLKLWWGPPA